jgi:hypothetical protein
MGGNNGGVRRTWQASLYIMVSTLKTYNTNDNLLSAAIHILLVKRVILNKLNH